MSNTSLLGSFGGQTGESLMFRNRIINGDMRIDQRYNGAVTAAIGAAVTYVTDRFYIYNNTDAAALTAQQVSDAPVGFTKSLRVTVGATADSSLAATQRCMVDQPIEGNNIIDLSFGTSLAKTITISFWVKSSVIGNFAFVVTSPSQTSYTTTYTINAANTWEYKTITIPGAVIGTWNVNNSAGLTARFGLGAGTEYHSTPNSWLASLDAHATATSVSLVATANATWQVTGVQLEAGPTATPFERRPIGMELSLCQRYYERNDSIETGLWWSGYTVSGATYYANEKFKVVKRATPAPIVILASEANNAFVSFSTSSQNIYGFRAQGLATATTSMSYYRAAWAADAEF